MVEDLKMACESWTGVMGAFVSAGVVQLFAQRVAYQLWKVGESKFLGKCGDIACTLLFLH
jgi:hypothetical protein